MGKPTRSSKQTAATLVETALGCIVFFLLLFGIINLSLYFLVASSLSKGANDALNVAAVTRDFNNQWYTLPDPQAQESFNAYRQALARIEEAGLKTPNASIIGEHGSGKFAELKQASINYQPGPQQAYLKFAILRPGEQATINGKIIANEIGSSTSSSDMNSLLRNYPIQIEMHATIPLLFPFIDGITIVGRAIGYRELSTPFSAPAGLPLNDQLLSSSPSSSSASSSSSQNSSVYSSTSSSSSSSSSSDSSSSSSSILSQCSAADEARCVALAPPGHCGEPIRGNCAECRFYIPGG